MSAYVIGVGALLLYLKSASEQMRPKIMTSATEKMDERLKTASQSQGDMTNKLVSRNEQSGIPAAADAATRREETFALKHDAALLPPQGPTMSVAAGTHGSPDFEPS